MKLLWLLFFIFSFADVFSQPSNDDCSRAINLQSVVNYCSASAQYSTVGATPSFINSGNDVWFAFTARAYDVTISVTGNTDGGGTLSSPDINLFSDCNGAGLIGTSVSENNQTVYHKGGLLIGARYYIQVAGTNTGTFRVCINNFNPILKPGQDYVSASTLCNKESFTQSDVTGAGSNNMESAGTCLDNAGQANEANTAWYKWTAATSGSLTFTITPTANDDIDWVLYDLGTADNLQLPSSANAIRCAAGRGIDCPVSDGRYQKTGLSLNAADLREAGGCGPGKDGFVRFVDMQKDHVYALLVNNFDTGNNGFSLEFGGTGLFVGPVAKISASSAGLCSAQQEYAFSSESTSYTSLRWTFGEGANVPTANTPGPHIISYATRGFKTVVLEAIGDKGCFTVDTRSFYVGITPDKPIVGVNKPDFCLKDTIELTTDSIPGLTYTWSGPGNFSSSNVNLIKPIRDEADAGEYTLIVSDGECLSEVTRIIIPPIKKSPVAAFRTRPSLPAKLSFPVEVTFFNDSQDSDSYLWDFGDGTTSTAANPTHTYSSVGDFDVTLTAFKSDICSTSIMLGKFVIKAANTLFVPNTFTPNSDGINDEFVVSITNLVDYHIRIFNRYGKQLFESADIFDNWKGIYNGEPLPVGTYYFILDAKDLSGKIIKQSGSVTIIR